MCKNILLHEKLCLKNLSKHNSVLFSRFKKHLTDFMFFAKLKFLTSNTSKQRFNLYALKSVLKDFEKCDRSQRSMQEGGW